MQTHSFDTEIAKLHGVNAALLIQNIAFWIEKNRANGENFRDGRYWTYMSYSAFGEIFPYLGQKQIRGALNKLRDEGLIITGNYSEKGKVNVTWYALTDKGERLVYPQSNSMPKGQATDNDACQNDKQLCQNGRELCQNDKHNKDIIQRYNNIYIQHDEDDCSYPDARACAREEVPEEDIAEYLDFSDTAKAIASDIEPEEVGRYIRTAWKYHIGKSPNATNIDDIRSCAAINRMQVEAINFALSLAARNASGSITGYTCECLKNWAALGYHTIDAIFTADIEQRGLMPLIGGSS